MRRVALLAAALAVAACVEKSPGGGEKPDPAYAKTQILSTEPTPQHVVNANIGDKILYLGCDVDKASVKPGEKFTVTHYWKVLNPPGGDYRVFTHVKGQSGADWINVDATKMRAAYPTSEWKAGDVFRDEQAITLKAGWTSPFLTVNVGLYRKGQQGEDARLQIISGPNDGHRAVVALRLPVGAAPAAATPKDPSEPKGYVVKRASGAITVDGKADEAAWAQAMSTGPFTDAEGAPTQAPATQARLLWDDQHLYVFVEATDSEPHSPYKKHDDPLWKGDVVELFIDADRNGRGYVELQVNPNNAVFDSWFSGTRAQPGDPSWQSGMKTAVTQDATGWRAEIAIPLEAVKGRDAAMAVTLPPKPGDTWKLNVVRADVPKGKKGLTSASAWAPISWQDWHSIHRLNVVTFGDEQGKVPATAAATQPSAPAAGQAPDAPGPKQGAGPVVPATRGTTMMPTEGARLAVPDQKKGGAPE